MKLRELIEFGLMIVFYPLLLFLGYFYSVREPKLLDETQEQINNEWE